MRNHKTEAHDDAHDGAENDVPENELQDEAEFLGDEDDEKDLYDALDALTQNVVDSEKEMEIKDKLVRYRNILINKTNLQEKTGNQLKAAQEEVSIVKQVEAKQFKELEQKGKDIKKLTKELRNLKKQSLEIKEESKRKDVIITKLKEAFADQSEIQVIEPHAQHVNHNCNACNKNFKTGHDLEKHIDLEHNENTCTYCDKRFNGERELLNHHKRCVDEGLAKSRCNNCKKIFNNFALKRHKEKCHKKEVFDCAECGEMCNSALETL